MGPAIGAFAILVKGTLNPSWMIIFLSGIGIVSACSLNSVEVSDGRKALQSQSGMRAALSFWHRNSILFLTIIMTSIYNFVDAALWFSFFYILKVEMHLGDTAVALGLIPGVLGCIMGYLLSYFSTGNIQKAFLLAYGLLLLGVTPMVLIEKGIVAIGATVLLLSMSNIIHSSIFADLRLHIIPSSIEGHTNSWITVVIRTGNLVALVCVPFIYENLTLVQLHCIFL